MNDTPQGDGNQCSYNEQYVQVFVFIRMNDTPQGDGNFFHIEPPYSRLIRLYKNE